MVLGLLRGKGLGVGVYLRRLQVMWLSSFAVLGFKVD